MKVKALTKRHNGKDVERFSEDIETGLKSFCEKNGYTVVTRYISGNRHWNRVILSKSGRQYRYIWYKERWNRVE